MKTVATISSNGPIIHAEIQEGKDLMRTKPYFESYGATAACVIRLARGTKNCGQRQSGHHQDHHVRNLFYGDSWFASLKAAVGCVVEAGSEFLGIVKTAHRGFPKIYLETTMKDWPPGTHLVLETIIGMKKYYAIGYKYCKRKVICFIATEFAGHTLPGVPYKGKWVDNNGKTNFRNIKRPHLISLFFHNSNQIDKHNHARQYVLGIEKQVVTTCGYYRLYSTYLGICITDAWKLYRAQLGVKHNDKQMSIYDFTNILCKECLLNEYDKTAYEKRLLPILQAISPPHEEIDEMRHEASVVSNLGSGRCSIGSVWSEKNNAMRSAGPGKFIPSTYFAPHDEAELTKEASFINQAGGSFSNRRRKRGKCSLCRNNTPYKCSICSTWTCGHTANHERECFNLHKRLQVEKECKEHWQQIHDN